MTINEKIKADRIKKGYTQLEYAELLGVSSRILKYWESGREIPHLTEKGIEFYMRKIKKKR